MNSRTHQTFILGLVIVLAAGCGLTGEQRIAQLQNAVTATQQLSQQLSGRIVELEKALADAQALAKQPGVAPATVVKLQSDIAMLQAKLAQAKPVQETLDRQLAAYEAQLKTAMAAPIDVAGEAKLYGQGVSTIGAVLPPPFNIYAGVIGSLIGVGGGVAGAILKGRKDGKAVTGIVESVNALLDPKNGVIAESAVDDAKYVLARAQVKTPEAAAAIRKVLDSKAA